MSLLNLVLSFFEPFDIHRAKVSCGSACRYLFESVVELGGGLGEAYDVRSLRVTESEAS